MSAIPKVGMHLGTLGFIPCTLLHLWKCVSHLNTLGLMGLYISHLVANLMLGLQHWGTIIVVVHCVIEAHYVVISVDHVATNVHYVVSVHRNCFFFQILSLLFIVLSSPFVVSTTPIPTLSCLEDKTNICFICFTSLGKCVYATTSFDLWMSKGAHTLVVNFLKEDWILEHMLQLAYLKH
jgi:hypothetical protein